MTETNDLIDIEPEEALNEYLAHRENEVSESTHQAHRYRLQHFVRWCNEEGTENLNELTGRDLHKYRTWRRQEGDLSNVSLVTQLSTLRVFIKWCERIEAVEQGLHDKILIPDLSKHEDKRDVMLGGEEAGKLIEYLRQFEFGTRTHAVVEVLWHTGIRIGAAHSLDIEDYDGDEQYLRLRHRPDTGTRLKNKEDGERFLALSDDVCSVLDGYIEFNRIEVEDDHGRRPLFTSKFGRCTKSTIRDGIYQITRPCEYTGECPHGREIESCEAMEHNKASRCPSSVSPHAIRRGSITHHLSEDVPETVVSDRMNVSPDILEKHYDRRKEREKAEQRRYYLQDLE